MRKYLEYICTVDCKKFPLGKYNVRIYMYVCRAGNNFHYPVIHGESFTSSQRNKTTWTTFSRPPGMRENFWNDFFPAQSRCSQPDAKIYVL